MSPSSSVEDGITITTFSFGLVDEPAAQRPRAAQLFQGSCPGGSDAALRDSQPGTDLVVGQGWVGQQQIQELAAILRQLLERLAQRLRAQVLHDRLVEVE